MTNVNHKILSHLGRNLHLQPHHPLGLIKENIVNYINSRYKRNRGIPAFSVLDNLSPV